MPALSQAHPILSLKVSHAIRTKLRLDINRLFSFLFLLVYIDIVVVLLRLLLLGLAAATAASSLAGLGDLGGRRWQVSRGFSSLLDGALAF